MVIKRPTKFLHCAWNSASEHFISEMLLLNLILKSVYGKY